MQSTTHHTLSNVFVYILIPICSFAVSLLVAATLVSFFTIGEFALNVDIFQQKLPYVIAGVFTAIICCIAIGITIYYNIFAASKLLNKAEDAKTNIYGNSHWLTSKEIVQKFKRFDFKKLPETQIHGYVVDSILEHKNLKVVLIPGLHALVVGVTGDGKSLRFLGMSIQANAISATKPTMIINDAKGELFSQHSKVLKDNGYDVMLINLRTPRDSVRYNPLTLIWDLFMKAMELEAKSTLTFEELDNLYKNYCAEQSAAVINYKVSKNKKKLKASDDQAPSLLEKEEFYVQWQSKQLKTAAELKDRAEVLIKEISRILVPESEGESKQWSDGAYGICTGIIYAMLEDGQNKQLNFTRDMFTITQISNIVNRHQKNLNDFLKLRPLDSPVFNFAGNIIDNDSEKTVSSYLSTLSTALNNFLEGGLEYIFSGTDVDLSTLVTRPTAIFILCPDEYLSRHPLISMIISQIYNELIFQSSTYKNNCLPRPVYFMLDEFGNLPKIPNLPTWITISKSRGIFFNLIVQALSQIQQKYNELNAKTLIQNCHLQMIMGSNEEDTIEHFSKVFGTRTIINRTSNYDPKNAAIDFHGSSQLAQVDLLPKDQLRKIEPGCVYWKLLRENPAKTHLEIIYNVTNIIHLGSINATAEFKPFDKKSLIYDLEERNSFLQMILRKNSKPTPPRTPNNSESSSQEQKKDTRSEVIYDENEFEEIDMEEFEIPDDVSDDNEISSRENKLDIHQKLFNL